MRIVAGRWRRTPIAVISRTGLRPTPERVRETVFDWLTHLRGSLDGMRTLDMFAGSGAMGFEAASRGGVTRFMEKDPAVVQKLRETVARLKAQDVCQVSLGDAFSLLEQENGQFDFIVIDPPYTAKSQLDAVRRGKTYLAAEGLIYVEQPEVPLSADTLEVLGLVAVRTARAGQVVYALLARSGSAMAEQAKPFKEKLSKVERAQLRRQSKNGESA